MQAWNTMSHGGHLSSGGPRLLAKVGLFQTGTGAIDQTITVSDVGFKPKVIFFSSTSQNSTGNTQSGENHFRSFGFATSPSNRFCIGNFSEDGQATCDADRIQMIDRVFVRMRTDAFVDGAWDLLSMDSGGFTLVTKDVPGTQVTVQYLALGGDAIINAVGGIGTEPGATGTFDITYPSANLPFYLPKVVAILNGNIIGSGTTFITTRAGISLGASDGTNQFVFNVISENGNNLDLAASYHYNAECIAGLDPNGSLAWRASFDSFLTNGFRLNALERNNSRDFFWLSIGGGLRAHVGGFSNPTSDATPLSITGLGFKPRAILFIGGSTLLSSQDTGQTAIAKYSIGMATDASNQRFNSTRNEAGADTSNVAHAIGNNAIQNNINATVDATEDSRMQLVSMDNDGFTITMSNADSDGYRTSYIAFGDDNPA